MHESEHVDQLHPAQPTVTTPDAQQPTLGATGGGPVAPSDPVPPQQPGTRPGQGGRTRRDAGIAPTRLGGLWIALTSGAVVLLLLLIFVLENGQRVDIAYFGVHGHLPLGVALLLAAVFGILLVVVPGGGRILQLRLAARRNARRAAKPGAPPPAAQQEPVEQQPRPVP